MSYEKPTPAEFKIAKPQFAAVNNETVQMYLDMASRVVDESWTEGDYKNAIIAFACHLMTLEGLGTDAYSQGFKTGQAEYESIKSGQVTLTKFRAKSEGTGYFAWLQTTPCGKYYAMLLQLNRGGPRIIMGGVSPCGSPYAKDHPGPAYGWPGVFY